MYLILSLTWYHYMNHNNHYRQNLTIPRLAHYNLSTGN